MSSRAYICIQKENNTYLGIYLHNDGYLSNAGSILFDYYQNEKKVNELINLGDLLILKPNLYPNQKFIHSFNNPQIGVSLFYQRDGNYQNINSRIINLKNLTNDYWIEHCYVYGLNHKWYYFENKTRLILLEEALNNYYLELGFPRIVGFYGKYTLEEIAYFKKQAELKKNLLELLKKDQ